MYARADRLPPAAHIPCSCKESHQRKHTRPACRAKTTPGPLCPSPHRASATRNATVDGVTQTVLAETPRWGCDVKGFTNAAERRDARERLVRGELQRDF